MASPSTVSVTQYSVYSVVCGHHIYKRIWHPVVGEKLQLIKDNGNRHDRYAVNIIKNEEAVGHIPKEISKSVWFGESAICEIIGHRKKGKGLEVPCKYTFTGRKALVTRIKEILGSYQQRQTSNSCPP